MSQVGTALEPGWRPDPSGRFEWRYWDNGWTNRVANSAPAAPQDAAPATVGNAPVANPDAAASRVEPFGRDDLTAGADQVPDATEPARQRRAPWTCVSDFLRSFANQPESYQSPHTAPVLPPDPRPEAIIAAPGNYGHAGIVALAACGIAGGAYLPWLSGTLGDIPFRQTGFDLGHGWAYGLGAAALAVSALLAVRMRVLRWVAIVLALVMAGLTVRDLIDTYNQMQSMNLQLRVSANVGVGLWIMMVSAAIAMIAAVRLTEDEKIS
jgi:hypothetical protein